MNDPFSLDDSNRSALMLSQAMLGAISPNFRMVTLTQHDGCWQIQFFLETDDAEDREEILEIALEFESLQETNVNYEVEIVISSDAIKWPELPTRVVYRRREVF
jgi:hypothetical protein